MSALAKGRQVLPEREFEWRDGSGEFHKPAEMVTRHLFHTISMIWNHAMPEEARTHDYRQYRFPRFYTADYMQRAVRAMLPELMKRNDLTTPWRKRLEFMRGWLAAQDGEEVATRPGVAPPRLSLPAPYADPPFFP